MRIIVCGSRTYKDRATLFTTLDGIKAEAGIIDLVIHGGANGADALAGAWCRKRLVPETACYADWKVYGRRAGPMRNQWMLEEFSPHLVVAFVDKPLEESKGTAHMVNIARKAGREVVVIGP